jgi:hypothetical protein
MYRPPNAELAFVVTLQMCSWKLSFESNTIPSHLICGDSAIIFVLSSDLLGIDIDGKLFWSFLRLVKWINSHFLVSIERPFLVSHFLTVLYAA